MGRTLVVLEEFQAQAQADQKPLITENYMTENKLGGQSSPVFCDYYTKGGIEAFSRSLWFTVWT